MRLGLPPDPMIARDPSGAMYQLRAEPHAGGLIALSDETVVRLMTADVALELVWQLLRSVEHVRHPQDGEKA